MLFSDVNRSIESIFSTEPSSSSLLSACPKRDVNCGQQDQSKIKPEAQQNNANITKNTKSNKAPKEQVTDGLIICDSKALHSGTRTGHCSNPSRSLESKGENVPLKETAPHLIPVIVEIKASLTLSNRSKEELVIRNSLSTNKIESIKSDIDEKIAKSVRGVKTTKEIANRLEPQSSCIRNSETITSYSSSSSSANKASKRQQQINRNDAVHKTSVKSKVKQKVGSICKLCGNEKDCVTKSINDRVENQLSPLKQSFKSEKLSKEIDLDDNIESSESRQTILDSSPERTFKCEINKSNFKINDVACCKEIQLKSVKTCANILAKHTCSSDSIVLQQENHCINISSGCNKSLHQDISVPTTCNGRQISRSDPHPNLDDNRQEIQVNALHSINTVEVEYSGSINTICNAKRPADVTDGVIVPLSEGNSHSGFPFLRRDYVQIGSNVSSKNNNVSYCTEPNSRNVTSTLNPSAGSDSKGRQNVVTGNNSQTLEITPPASIMSTSTDCNDNRLGLAPVKVELQGKVDMEAAFSKLLETFDYRSDTSPSPCSSGGISDPDTSEDHTTGLPSANSKSVFNGQSDKNSNIVKSTKCIRLTTRATNGTLKVSYSIN